MVHVVHGWLLMVERLLEVVCCLLVVDPRGWPCWMELWSGSRMLVGVGVMVVDALVVYGRDAAC